MNGLFFEQVCNFVNGFYLMYIADRYISKSEIDHFFDKYTDIIQLSNKYTAYEEDEMYKKFIIILNYGYDIITTKNNKYISKHMELDNDYFDSIFKDVDSKIILDNEQRRAILIDEDYSLIVAGAGSGKTTTMAAKVKYLIEKKKVNPNNIILLSFTNSSVDDLNDLINNKFKLNVEVLTFHKLGVKFLRGAFNRGFDIIANAGIYQVLSDYFLKVIFKNKKMLQEYMEVFSRYLILDRECLNYEDYDEYYKYFMDKKYELCKDNLSEEIKKRLEARGRYLKTINGETVKSNGELKIANYLYCNGIDYRYEKLYPYLLSGHRSYKPDFTINNFEAPIYIEYYGLAMLKVDGVAISDDENYQQEIILKRNTHIKNKTDLIELYGRYEDSNNYLSVLSNELLKRNMGNKLRSEKEIFYRLLETSKPFMYGRLIRLFQVFINLFKEKNYSVDDFSILESNCTDETLKRQLRYLKDVYVYYQEKIHKQYKIDFQDMIHYAYANMEKLESRLKYDYVIIDEYQDISYQRFSFVKKISDLFKAKIVAVGDDWQTIYSFSGSDIDLFTKFEEVMGYGEQIQIVNTYRNSQELIDLAGDFVLKNNLQIEKKLHSNKHLAKPVRLVEYDYDNLTDNLPGKLVELLISIYNKHPNDNILLLSRFNLELDYLLESKLFYKNTATDNRVICKAIPNAKIDFLTIHKSKGLGYDRVVLLNGIDGAYGFPSQIKDEPIIKYLKGEYDMSENIKDNIAYPEERRLFYVAMTRTKNELYIMTPTLYEYRSSFVKEIQNHDNVKNITDTL